MRQEERTVCFDRELKIEAYRFKGIMQKFPNHFHEHYVIGFIEKVKDIYLVKIKSIPQVLEICYFLTLLIVILVNK
ncbi:hypothetical protein [Clostridioides difficile]|uniref:hypothetical protein n=1 Tax=Clostridioides difficile TaxID=1496 RepID=UPI002E8E1565|nr:hypothetical protein [Clostridioides difficile]